MKEPKEFSEQQKQKFEKSLKKVFQQRERIVRSFCAEFGCLPSQCCQLTKQLPDGSMQWRIVKLEAREKKPESRIIVP